MKPGAVVFCVCVYVAIGAAIIEVVSDAQNTDEHQMSHTRVTLLYCTFHNADT